MLFVFSCFGVEAYGVFFVWVEWKFMSDEAKDLENIASFVASESVKDVKKTPLVLKRSGFL